MQDAWVRRATIARRRCFLPRLAPRFLFSGQRKQGMMGILNGVIGVAGVAVVEVVIIILPMLNAKKNYRSCVPSFQLRTLLLEDHDGVL